MTTHFDQLSAAIEPPCYPHNKKEYHALVKLGHVQPFRVEYLNNKVSLLEENDLWTKIRIDNFTRTYAEAAIVNSFKPDNLEWEKIVKRLTGTLLSRRRNTDLRLSYLIHHNTYLVKPLFTFGQCSVKPGTSHVYQTTFAPLLFYILPAVNTTAMKIDSVFHCYDQHLYKRYILQPHTQYVVPEGTTYVLIAVQKSVFAVDVVNFEVEGSNPTEATEWFNTIGGRLVRQPSRPMPVSKKFKTTNNLETARPMTMDAAVQTEADNIDETFKEILGDLKADKL